MSPTPQGPDRTPILPAEHEAKLVFGEHYHIYKNYCQKLWSEFVELFGADWYTAIARFDNRLEKDPPSLEPLGKLSRERGDVLSSELIMKVRRSQALFTMPNDFFLAWEKYLAAHTADDQRQIISETNTILSDKSNFDLNQIIDVFSEVFKYIDFSDEREQKFKQLSFLDISLRPKPSSFKSACVFGKIMGELVLERTKNLPAPVRHRDSECVLEKPALSQKQANYCWRIVAATLDWQGSFKEVPRLESTRLSIDPSVITTKFEKALEGEFKKVLKNTDTVLRQDLSIDTLLAQVSQLTSPLGLRNHPYLNDTQSYPPELKIDLISWRKKSQKAFLLSIANFSKQERTNALLLFKEVQTLYNNLLSNTKDYLFLHERLTKLNKFQAIKKEFNLSSMKEKNLLFFRKMRLPEFSSIGHLYPLNKYQFKRTINKLTGDTEEKEVFYADFSFSHEDIIKYLECAKEMLTTLNTFYYSAKTHLDKLGS